MAAHNNLAVLGGRVKDKTTGEITEFSAGTDILAFGDTNAEILVLDDLRSGHLRFLRGPADRGQRGTPIYQTFGSIATQILTWCNVPTALIDTAAFTQADTDAPQTLGLYIPGRRFRRSGRAYDGARAPQSA